MADIATTVYDKGTREGFTNSTAAAVNSVLSDPRAPVVEADPTFMDTVAASWRSGTSIGSIIAATTPQPDPDNNPPLQPSEVYTRLQSDGMGANADAFYGVRDEATYQAVLADVKRELADRRTMQEAGLIKSIGAGLLAGFADPINLIPIGGALSRVGMAAEGAMRTAGKLAVPAGAAALATEAVVQSQSQTKTAAESVLDVAAGTAFGATLGFAIHAAVGRPLAKQIETRLTNTTSAPPEVIAKDMRANMLASYERVEPVASVDPAAVSGASKDANLADVGDMAAGMSKSMRDGMWTSFESDKTKFAGVEDPALKLALEAKARGDVTTREEFDAFLTDYGNGKFTDQGGPKPQSLSAAATGEAPDRIYSPPVEGTSDRIDARLLGIPIDKAMKIPGKAVQFLRNPRLEMQDASVAAVRDALDVLDVNPWITKTDVRGTVTNDVNFPGIYRDTSARYLNAQQDAEFLYRRNKASYKNQDDFGNKVYAAVIQGGRSPTGDKVVEQAAAGYRTYFDHVLKMYRDAGLLDERATLNNAESYAPIVHLVANIRNDTQRFLKVHGEAFNTQIVTDWHTALDRKRMWEAQHGTAIDASKKVRDDAVKAVNAEYGASPGSTYGKVREARNKVAEELERQIALQADTLRQKTTELGGRLADNTITKDQHTKQLAVLKERHKADIAAIREQSKADAKAAVDKAIAERDQKIEAVNKKHDDLIAKLEENRPEWDKTLLNKLTQDRGTAYSRAKAWSDELAKAYYDGASKNAVVGGHDGPQQSGLGQVLKARKSELWQQTAADNGWIETNIFRLTEHYNRRAGADAALATVFKKIDPKTGEPVGDIYATARIKDMEDQYKVLIDKARDAGDGPLQERLVQERGRQIDNFNLLLDMTRGVHDPNTVGMDIKRVGDIAMMYNSWRLMGGTVASSLGDPVNIVLANGLGNALKFGVVPAFQNFRTAMKSIPKSELPDIYRINRLFGIVVEHQNNSRIAAMADLAGGAPETKSAAWMQRVNKTFWDVTGITYWTQFWKDTAVNVTHGRIIMAAQEGWGKQSKATQAWLTNLKIDQITLDRIGKLHAAQDQKYSAGIPYGALDKWADREVADLFANALHRESHNVVITPTAGDKLALQATPIGQLAWQFRSYGVASTARLIGRNAALGGIDNDHRLQAYVGLVGLMLAGTLVDGVKSALGDVTIGGSSKDGKDTPFDKYIDRWKKTPGEAAYNMLDRSGTMWVLTEPSNVMQKLGLPNIQGAMSLALGDEKDARSGSSRFAQRGVAESLLGPTAALVEDIPKLAGFVTSAAGHVVGINEDFNVGRTDFARMRRLAPLGNAIGVQQVLNYGHQQLGTIFDWPEPK